MGYDKGNRSVGTLTANRGTITTSTLRIVFVGDHNRKLDAKVTWRFTDR